MDVISFTVQRFFYAQAQIFSGVIEIYVIRLDPGFTLAVARREPQVRRFSLDTRNRQAAFFRNGEVAHLYKAIGVCLNHLQRHGFQRMFLIFVKADVLPWFQRRNRYVHGGGRSIRIRSGDVDLCEWTRGKDLTHIHVDGLMCNAHIKASLLGALRRGIRNVGSEFQILIFLVAVGGEILEIVLQRDFSGECAVVIEFTGTQVFLFCFIFLRTVVPLPAAYTGDANVALLYWFAEQVAGSHLYFGVSAARVIRGIRRCLNAEIGKIVTADLYFLFSLSIRVPISASQG